MSGPLSIEFKSDAAIELDFNQNVRCVVLQGEGRFFCTGGDLTEFASAKNPSTHLAELAGTLHTALSHFFRIHKPIIAAVNGPAAGAGLSLALVTDIFVASRSAHFTAAYTAIGLTPDGGLTYSLPRLIGLAATKDLLLINLRCGADEAKSLGKISRVIDDAIFDHGVAQLVTEIANGPTHAFGATRNLLNQTFSQTFEAQTTLEMRAISKAGASAEFHEGLLAFKEKHTADFKGTR